MSMGDEKAFERLLHEAENHPFAGWDFSFVSGRIQEQQPDWNYRAEVKHRIREASSLLDMGTGGGEFLSSLAPLPPGTCATEAYAPNVPVARGRLQPLGVDVYPIDSDDELPFMDGQFNLVINRHEAYSPKELQRILQPGGTFITQQVGGRNNVEINHRLGTPVSEDLTEWNLTNALADLKRHGFTIIRQQEALLPTTFRDVGALVYYLRAIPWQVPDFSVWKYRDRLYKIHQEIQETGTFESHVHRFYIEARRSFEGVTTGENHR